MRSGSLGERVEKLVKNSRSAIELIHRVSRGLPRIVNNLAVQSLVATFAAGKKIVDEPAARAAVTEVSAE